MSRLTKRQITCLEEVCNFLADANNFKYQADADAALELSQDVDTILDEVWASGVVSNLRITYIRVNGHPRAALGWVPKEDPDLETLVWAVCSPGDQFEKKVAQKLLRERFLKGEGYEVYPRTRAYIIDLCRDIGKYSHKPERELLEYLKVLI